MKETVRHIAVRFTIEAAQPSGGHANRAFAALDRDPNNREAQLQCLKALLASQNPKSTERVGQLRIVVSTYSV